MKKFQFSLDTVLDYKQQVLDSLLAEHGTILARVRKQEKNLEDQQTHYVSYNAEFCEKKKCGITVVDALMCTNGLRVLEQHIQLETIRLEELRQMEALKREEVVEARKETASIEKLRENKLKDYNKAVQKSEEAFIDEFVSTARSTARNSEAQIGA